jgi:hypothetical protein
MVTLREFDEIPVRVAVQDQNGSPVDISGVTSPLIIFRSPGPLGTYAKKTAAIVNDSGVWKLEYTTESDLLAEPGEWSLQGRFTFGGLPLTSPPVCFLVQETDLP